MIEFTTKITFRSLCPGFEGSTEGYYNGNYTRAKLEFRTFWQQKMTASSLCNFFENQLKTKLFQRPKIPGIVHSSVIEFGQSCEVHPLGQ